MRYFIIALAVLTASACVPSEPSFLVHRAGSNYAERSRDIDQCQFAAIQAVPRALATQVSGGYSNPGTTQCSTIGTYTSCQQVGAVNIPATATTYDANLSLRKRFVDRCLMDAGYGVYPKPQCRTEAERAAFRQTLDNQPPASQIPCVEIR